MGRAAGVEGRRQKTGKWNKEEITGDKEQVFDTIHQIGHLLMA